MRKFFGLLLCLALIISLAAMPALADAGDTAATSVPVESRAARVTLGGTKYTVGFYGTDGDGTPYVFEGGTPWTNLADYYPDENAQFRRWMPLQAGAFIWNEASKTYETAMVEFTVNSMAIHSDDGIFSFSGGAELVLTYTGAAEYLYWLNNGKAGEATVGANVTVTAGEYSETVDVYVHVKTEKAEAPQLAFYTAAEGGTKIEYAEEVCYYTLPTEGKVWLIADAALTGQTISVFAYQKDWQITWEGNPVEIVLPKPEGDMNYSVNALCGNQQYNFIVRSRPSSSAFSFEYVDGAECLVGISTGGAYVLDGYNSIIYTSTEGYSEDAPWVEMSQLSVAACTVYFYSDGGAHYVPVSDVDIQVSNMSIRHISGDEDSFSFSPHDIVPSMDGAAGALYCREGSEATALVSAVVTIVYNDQTYDNKTVYAVATAERTGLKFYSAYGPDGPVEGSYIAPNSMVCYYDLTDGQIWLTSEEKFNFGNLTIWAGNEAAKYEIIDDTTIKITLPEPTDDMGYGLNVSAGGENSSIGIDRQPRGSCIRVPLHGEEYIVGFVFDYGETGDVIIINEGNWTYSNSTTMQPDKDNGRYNFREMAVTAGRREVDEENQPYYIPDDRVSATVTDMEIRTLYGEGEGFGQTFSFSQDSGEAVTRLESVSGNSAYVYVKEGYVATALVTATVDVYVDGKKYTTGTIGTCIEIYRSEGGDYVRPENDTVEELNAALIEATENLPQDGRGDIRFTLTADRYEGTIVLPKKLLALGNYEIWFESPNGTVIEGGIDLNGSACALFGIDFIAPEKGEGEETTRALYNGRAEPRECTFQGYDVALDASVNTINPHYCVFADNVVAARVDLPTAWQANMNPWEGNAFINNDTAVQVMQLNELLSPYYFRIYECNFVNNRVTFDVSCSGTLYLYRNYYGESLNNMTSAEIFEEIQENLGSQIFNTIINCPPTVNAGDSGQTRVITNPRWIFPYFDPTQLYPDLPRTYDGMRMLTFSSVAPLSLSGMAPLSLTADEQEEENYLTADWDRPTEIIDTESANLMIDAGAFDKETEEDRIITVVGQQGTTLLGTWNLGKAAHEGLEGSFDASLSVVRGADGVITVTVNADTALLAALKPTLTIPDAAGGVRYGDDVLKSIEEDGSVKFTVEAGGVYVISEDISESPEEPDPPEDPEDPEDPGTPEDPETPGEPAVPNVPHVPETPDTPAAPDGAEMPFADVAEGDWFYDAVSYVYANGLMDGVSTTEFNPNGTMTRAMLWTILARIDGQTVTGESWIETARAWAMAEGVSDGENANGLVTREQFATMLWRYAGEPESDYALSTYTDAASVSSYALDAMRWAVENGIITGVSATTIVPQGTATRAQAAAMLMRFIENIV